MDMFHQPDMPFERSCAVQYSMLFYQVWMQALLGRLALLHYIRIALIYSNILATLYSIMYALHVRMVVYRRRYCGNNQNFYVDFTIDVLSLE